MFKRLINSGALNAIVATVNLSGSFRSFDILTNYEIQRSACTRESPGNISLLKLLCPFNAHSSVMLKSCNSCGGELVARFKS